MSRRSVLLCVVIALCITASVESAVAPSTVNYQAVLTSGGSPVITPVTVTFTIYDADIGGSPVWTETRSVTPDALGRVSVRLGEQTALGSAAFAGSNRWLGVQVGGDPEMTPRMPVSSSSYALRTATIDGASGGNLEGDLVLHESALKEFMASSAQIILVSLAGDSTVIDPSKLRMVDNLGVEQVTMSTNPVTGPVLGIADPGGNVAGHTAAASSYYSNTALLKSPDALKKKLEVSADGIWIFDETTGDTVGSFQQTAEGPRLIMTHFAAIKDATQVSGSIQLGPPDTLFRLKDALGNTLMQGIQTPTGGTMQFFSKSGPLKLASSKTAEINELGMTLFDAVGSPIVRADAQTGYISGYRAAFGRNNNITITSTKDANGAELNPDPGLVAGDNNTLSGANASAIGDWNTVGGTNSIAIGNGNTMLGGRAAAIGSDNYVGVDANDNFVAGQGHFIEAIGTNIEQVFCLGYADTVTGLSGYSSCLGGRGHKLNDAGYCVIAGGDSSRMEGSWFSFIGAGKQHYINNAGYSGIVTGLWDTISSGGNASAILCGEKNHLRDVNNSWIGGGYGNRIQNPAGFVSNGVLAGGEGNVLSFTHASIGGGFQNSASSQYATVPGGKMNSAGGTSSFAAGTRAKADHSGTFVWGDATDADFSSTAANQFLIRAGGNVGINTNAPTSTLHVDGAIATKVVSITADHTMGSEAIVMASPTITGLTVSLPDPSTCEGRQITVKKINGGGGSVTVSAGTGAIDGVPTYVLAVQYDFVCVISDGNDWFIVAR